MACAGVVVDCVLVSNGQVSARAAEVVSEARATFSGGCACSAVMSLLADTGH